MNDQREWETLLHPGRTVGPLHPRRVAYAWDHLLAQGVERERLSAYAITAGGSTVYLIGPHPGGLPHGLSFREGGVNLAGLDERGVRVQLGGLAPGLADLYLFVADRRDDARSL
jgi:hypothetical protein